MNNNQNTFLYDLNDVYNNKLKKASEKLPILIDETSVDYDLLKRTDIIDKLYNSIIYSRSSHSYVIGLEGPWGCGKTTILNNVKSKMQNENTEKFCFIDSNEYDPWSYKNPEEMIFDLCKQIMYKLEKPSKRILWKICKNMIFLLSDFVKGKFHINLEYLYRICKNPKYITKTQETKCLMEKELQSNNKTIVVYVENIDRASKEKILMLFSMIGTIFNLPNVIYVIAYDKYRLTELLKDGEKINPEYIKKIINQEITVPEIEEDLKNDIYTKCITNILKGYGLHDSELKRYEYIINFINNNIEDLREFKRLINSAFYTAFGSFQKITYSHEKLALSIIKFMNKDLYEYIQDNSWFFRINKEPSDLNEAMATTTDIGILLNKNKTCKIVKEIDDNYSKYYCLLSNTFPILKDAEKLWIDNLRKESK